MMNEKQIRFMDHLRKEVPYMGPTTRLYIEGKKEAISDVFNIDIEDIASQFSEFYKTSDKRFTFEKEEEAWEKTLDYIETHTSEEIPSFKYERIPDVINWLRSIDGYNSSYDKYGRVNVKEVFYRLGCTRSQAIHYGYNPQRENYVSDLCGYHEDNNKAFILVGWLEKLQKERTSA